MDPVDPLLVPAPLLLRFPFRLEPLPDPEESELLPEEPLPMVPLLPEPELLPEPDWPVEPD